MSERTWRSLHVAYHDRNMDDLICDGVAPLLAPGQAHGYVVRHWRRGPHLRLNVLTDEDGFVRSVRPEAARLVAASLARRPSAARLDRAALLAIHRRRAEVEGDEEPVTSWYEDNTVHDAEYEPPKAGFSGPAAAGFLEDFYCATGELVFDSLRQVRGGHSRLGTLFDVLLATAHGLGRGSRYSWISYRSHAEKFLHSSGETRAYVADWRRRHRRQRQELASRAEAVLHTLDSGGDGDTTAERWVRTLRPLWDRARVLVDSGGLSFPVPDPDAGLPALRDELTSPFHQAMLTNEGMYAHTSTPDFHTYRVMLTLTYAHAARVGISLVERYFLCHLVAAAMEDITGVDSTELVASASFFEGSATI